MSKKDKTDNYIGNVMLYYFYQPGKDTYLVTS
jgi:hypothetical protein